MLTMVNWTVLVACAYTLVASTTEQGIWLQQRRHHWSQCSLCNRKLHTVFGTGAAHKCFEWDRYALCP